MKEPKEDEIDLFRLLARIMSVIRTRMPVVLVMFMIGLIGGIICVYLDPGKYDPFYRREYLASSPLVSNSVLQDIINNVGEGPKPAGVMKIQARLQASADSMTRLKVFVYASEPAFIDSVPAFLYRSLDTLAMLQDLLAREQHRLKQLGRDLYRERMKYDSTQQSDAGLLEKIAETDHRLSSLHVLRVDNIASAVIYESNFRMKFLAVSGLGLLGFISGVLIAFLLEWRKKQRTAG